MWRSHARLLRTGLLAEGPVWTGLIWTGLDRCGPVLARSRGGPAAVASSERWFFLAATSDDAERENDE
ncbi:MAG: hypothetical protein ACK6CU_01150 [Deltaproteobacteria bacterium]